MSSALTPQFLMDLETNMRIITTRDYDALLQNLWWTKVAREHSIQTEKERIHWILETAQIHTTEDGNVDFEDLGVFSTEYTTDFAAAGLRLKRTKLEDLDANGIDIAANWASQIAKQAAYWPQTQVADFIKNNGLTYDGLSLFNAAHPVNVLRGASFGTFSNILGASAAVSGVTADVALTNFTNALATIATIPNATGDQPRRLRVDAILHPPALRKALRQVTDSEYIAAAAATGGGSQDVRGVLSDFNVELIQAEELSAAFGGSDSIYYMLTSEITADQLGAVLYLNREPFSVLYNGQMTDAELARTNELQWLTRGRNSVQGGHPYNIFRCGT